MSYKLMNSYDLFMQVERMVPRLPEVTGIVLGCALVLALVIGTIYYCKRRGINAKSKRRDLEVINPLTPIPSFFPLRLLR